MKKLKQNVSRELNLEETIHGTTLKKLLLEGNAIAIKIFKEYKKDLVKGVINVINVYDPEVVSIGGSLSYFEELFLDELNVEINNEFSKKNIGFEIKVTKLKNQAGLVGAAMLETI